MLVLVLLVVAAAFVGRRSPRGGRAKGVPAAKEGKWAGSTWTNTKNAARISSTCLGARQGAAVVLVEEEAEAGRLEEQDVGIVTKSSLVVVCACGRLLTQNFGLWRAWGGAGERREMVSQMLAERKCAGGG